MSIAFNAKQKDAYSLLLALQERGDESIGLPACDAILMPFESSGDKGYDFAVVMKKGMRRCLWGEEAQKASEPILKGKFPAGRCFRQYMDHDVTGVPFREILGLLIMAALEEKETQAEVAGGATTGE